MKKYKPIKFKQPLINGVDLEYLVNRVLYWAYDIYDKLFQGRKTHLLQGRHLGSFTILTNMGRFFHDCGIDLDLSAPQTKNHVRATQKKALIRQEYVDAADFAALLDELMDFMAKKTALADRVAGKWLPDDFTLGEIQAYNEAVGIFESVLIECGITPNNLSYRYDQLIKIS